MKLCPFQEKAVSELVNRRRRMILGSEMGTGKTAVAVRAAGIIMSELQATIDKAAAKWRLQVFVVCPSSLKLTWVDEIGLWDGNKKVQVIKKRSDRVDDMAHWVVFSYDTFFHQLGKFDKHPPAVVIFDESHMLKNRGTKRVKKMLGKVSPIRNSYRVWFLTGTPLPNRLADVWTVGSFCLYFQLGKFWDFAERYCIVKETPWGKKIGEARKKNLPELVERLAPVLYRDELKDVLPELPDFREQIIHLDANASVESLLTDLHEYKDEIAEAFKTGEPVDDNGHLALLRSELGREKIPLAVEFIKNLLDQGEPVVVFAHHRAVVDGLTEALGEHYRVASIRGGHEMEDRQQVVNDFQAGELDCVVLSIRAAGVGLTLHRAHIAVFVEQDWTPAAYEQARARIRRIGQKSFCIYYLLTFPNSIDDDVQRALISKDRDLKKFWGLVKKHKEESDNEGPNAKTPKKQ